MPYEAYQTWGRQRTNDRIEAHLPLVYSMASGLAPRATTAGLEMGDLVQTGVVALYTATEAFDETRGTTFGAFAKPFVRGAMLDEMSRHQNESRALRDKYKRVREAEDKLMRKLMREPTDAELAGAIGIDVKMLSSWLVEMGMRISESLEVLEERGVAHQHDETVAVQPELSFLEQESKQELVAALDQLSLREQQLLYLYYQEELTLKEIGYVLDLSESQVSRTHKRVLKNLRASIVQRQEA